MARTGTDTPVHAAIYTEIADQTTSLTLGHVPDTSYQRTQSVVFVSGLSPSSVLLTSFVKIEVRFAFVTAVIGKTLSQ